MNLIKWGDFDLKEHLPPKAYRTWISWRGEFDDSYPEHVFTKDNKTYYFAIGSNPPSLDPKNPTRRMGIRYSINKVEGEEIETVGDFREFSTVSEAEERIREII